MNSSVSHSRDRTPEPRLAAAMAAVSPPGLREVLAVACQPDILSFALGMPAPELFPAADLERAAARLLGSDPLSLQYGMPPPRLKRRIVELMARRGVTCREEQVFLTHGAQQGMALAARLLLDPGGTVLLEEIVYEGIQSAVQEYRPRILTVPADPETGLDVGAVERHLAAGERPAFLYVVPDGHNPLGASIGLAERRRLVALARRYGVPILEDDAYGFLGYGKQPPPPSLQSLDERWVVYLGSLSKTLAPGLRVGWMVAPEWLAAKLSPVKHASDLDASTFAQHVTAAYLEEGTYLDHVEAVRREYRRRRDAMLEALGRHLAGLARWSRPASGMFVWLELDDPVDTSLLLPRAAREERVAFCPGRAFAVAGGRGADHAMRLCFANRTPAEIEEGISRLARVLRRHRPAVADRVSAAAGGGA